MLNLEVRKRAGGGEVHRLDGAAITIGASSGNEVVVRARGVAGSTWSRDWRSSTSARSNRDRSDGSQWGGEGDESR